MNTFQARPVLRPAPASRVLTGNTLPLRAIDRQNANRRRNAQKGNLYRARRRRRKQLVQIVLQKLLEQS